MARTPSSRKPKRRDFRQKFVVQVPLPQETYARLRTGAAYYQLTMAAYVRRLIAFDVGQYEADTEVMRMPPTRHLPPVVDALEERRLAPSPDRLRSPWDRQGFDE